METQFCSTLQCKNWNCFVYPPREDKTPTCYSRCCDLVGRLFQQCCSKRAKKTMGRVYINIDCKVSPLFRLFFKISSREKEPDTSKSQVKPIKIYKDSLYQKFDEEDSHPRTPRHEKKISTPGNTPTRSPTIRGEKVDGQHLWE